MKIFRRGTIMSSVDIVNMLMVGRGAFSYILLGCMKEDFIFDHHLPQL